MRISDWSSDVCSSDLQAVLERFWRDFKPRTGEVMEQKPSEITAALDEFLGPYLFPDKGDGSDPRLCPNCGTGRLALRGGRFGPFIACSNYPDCKYTRKFAQRSEEHTSALQSLMRISYAVFCLKKKRTITPRTER